MPSSHFAWRHLSERPAVPTWLGTPPSHDDSTGSLPSGDKEIRGETESLQIALLDDDEGLLDVLSATLSAYGFRVSTFAQPGQMLEASDHGAFDAFVVDWRLGEVTAARAIYTLRALPRYADAPIFILSGNIPVVDTDWDRDLADLLSRHQVQYRAKPYRTRDLARELSQSIANARRQSGR